MQIRKKLHDNFEKDHGRILNAARRRDIVALYHFQKAGVNLQQRNTRGETPIYVLAKNGETNALDFLQQAKSDEEIKHLIELGDQEDEAYKKFVESKCRGIYPDVLDVVGGYAHGGYTEEVIKLIKENIAPRDCTCGLLYMSAINGYMKSKENLQEEDLLAYHHMLVERTKEELLKISQYQEISTHPSWSVGHNVEKCASAGEVAKVNRKLAKINDIENLVAARKKAAHGYGLCGNMLEIMNLLFDVSEMTEDNKTLYNEYNEDILYFGIHGCSNGSYFDHVPVLQRLLNTIPKCYREALISRVLENSDRVPQKSPYHLDFYLFSEIGEFLHAYKTPVFSPIVASGASFAGFYSRSPSPTSTSSGSISDSDDEICAARPGCR